VSTYFRTIHCDANLSPDGVDGPAVKGNINQSLSLTFGDRFRSKAFEAWVFAGPAFTLIYKGSLSDPAMRTSTVGLELKTLLMFRASKSAGFGVGCFGNLNHIKSFAGATISIVITNGN
jgi:hypothetical protein